MRVLMVAPPGAGKGTQGAVIAAHFDIPHIATGELLREHVAKQTDLGRAVQQHLDRGELVPDEIVLDMVRAAFVDAKSQGQGYVLDGMPRNLAQAMKVDGVTPAAISLILSWLRRQDRQAQRVGG